MKRFANISKLSVVLGILAFAAFVAFGLAGPANATVLNVDLFRNQGAVGLEYAGVGAGPGPGTFWNSMTTFSVPSGLLYDDGITPATGISVAVTHAENQSGVAFDCISSSYGISLFDTFAIGDPVTHGSPVVTTISGLDISGNTTYDVYVYSWLGTPWSWLYTSTNVVGATTSASWLSVNAGSGSSFVADSNWHEFPGLLPSATGTLVINSSHTSSEGYINAFQLVSHTVPEPSTLALLAAGLAGLLAYAWRKRK